MNMNFHTLLFVSILLSLTGLWETETSKSESDYSNNYSTTSSYMAPPEITVCGSTFDLDEYRLKNTAATYTAVANGRWDLASTWNLNGVPTAADAVIIPAGRTVRLNGACVAKNVTVNGILTNNTGMQNFTLNTEWVLASGAASRVRIGTAATPYTGQGTITLLGGNDGQNIFGLGDKFIGSYNGGTIEIHGANTISWSQLGANAPAGSTTITLKEPVSWPIGAEILITSSTTNWNQAEKRTITAKSGNTLTLNAGLTYKHTGVQKNYSSPTRSWTADLRAEVGLLSHNITIQGDASSDATGFGGHIMVHFGGKAYISGVELYRMGQKAILGRYPFHWHLVKNGGAGQYFKNNSVHKSFNRAITIHGTESTLVENNFCYDHIGHGIFLEDGGERYNVIRKNVVVLTKRPAAGQQLTPSDNSHNQLQNRTPSSYWITNPNNTFEDNVAAGTQGTGFWFAFPTAPMGDSGGDAYFNGIQPHKEPLGLFKGNKAHSCMNGFDIFDQLNPDHSLKLNWGWDNATPHVMEDCTWYANHVGIYAGIGAGGPVKNVFYRDNIFIDNHTDLFLATYNFTEQSVFVANSGEGLDLHAGEKALYATYDGAGTVRNSHFVGYNASNSNLIRRVGAATKHLNHRFYGITSNHAGTVRLSYPDHSINPQPNLGANDVMHPRVWNMVLHDQDGTLGGVPNSSIVTNHPLHLVGGETQPPNWTNAFVTSKRFALSFVFYTGAATSFPNMSMMRTKPGELYDAGSYYINGYQEKQQLPVIVNDDTYTYTYAFESLPANRQVQLYLDDATPGDRYLARFKDFGKLGGLSISSPYHTLTQHGSLAALKASSTSGYYRQANGDLYIRPVATHLRQHYIMTWSTSFGVPTLDSDGDGSSDSFEAARYRNPFDERDLAQMFDIANNFEGWAPTNMTGAQVNGGTFKATTAGDPQMAKNDFNFNANRIDFIVARMKANGNGAAQLFFGRNDAPGYAASRVATTQYSGGGNYELVVFDMRNNTEWINKITGLRFDPLPGAGLAIEVDWIATSDGDIDDDGIPDDIDDCITFNNTLNFTGTIPPGLHQSRVSITTNGIAPAASNITLESGVVEMNVGFDAVPDSNFEAKIGCQ